MKYILAILISLLIGQAKAAPSCIPGLYGEQWPGSVQQSLPFRTDNGWHAYGWCSVIRPNGVKVPVLVYRSCATARCWSLTQIGTKYGELAYEAVLGGKKEVFGAYYDAIPAEYRCGFPGEFSGTGALPLPAQGSAEALACADLRVYITRDAPAGWPAPAPVPPGVWLTTGLTSYNTSATGLLSSAGLISKGRVCDCTVPLKVGVTTYCTFTGAANPMVRAACAKP